MNFTVYIQNHSTQLSSTKFPNNCIHSNKRKSKW